MICSNSFLVRSRLLWKQNKGSLCKWTILRERERERERSHQHMRTLHVVWENLQHKEQNSNDIPRMSHVQAYALWPIWHYSLTLTAQRKPGLPRSQAGTDLSRVGRTSGRKQVVEENHIAARKHQEIARWGRSEEDQLRCYKFAPLIRCVHVLVEIRTAFQMVTFSRRTILGHCKLTG